MSFQVQNQIRQNATDIRNYLNDLYAWEEQVNTKEAPKTQPKPKKEYSIRGNVIENKEKSKQEDQGNENSSEKNKLLKRDKNSIPDYYRAWDQFNVDEELEKVEAETSEKPKIQTPQNLMQRTSGAKENTKIIIKGGRSADSHIDSLKERGNLYFKSSEYTKALEAYSECITKAYELNLSAEILATLHANRAITYIKLGEYLKAEEDGTKALQHDPRHLKALIRRGRAKHKLNKLKEALKDFEEAEKIEKENKEVLEEIAVIKRKMKNTKTEQKEKMVKILRMPLSTKEKYKVKVVDSTSKELLQQEERKEESVEEHRTLKKGSTSEFLGLKDVDGHIVHHEKAAETVTEEPQQKVHFKIDLNQDDEHLERHKPDKTAEPRKSALKKKSMTPKNVTNPTPEPENLKNSNAVTLGKKTIQESIINAATNGDKSECVKDSTEFESLWKHIKDNIDACEKFLLSKAKPVEFSKIFKQGLEFDLFMELVKFSEKISEKNWELAYQTMNGLADTKRFEILLKCLTKGEKKVILDVIQKLGNSEQAKSGTDYNRLKEKYFVN